MTREENFNSLLPKDLTDYYVSVDRPIEKYTLVSIDDSDPWIMNSDDKEKLIDEANGAMQWFNNKIYDTDTMEIVYEREKTIQKSYLI